MKIHSYNEWDQLRSIVVGSAKGANWPSTDPVFAQEAEKTTWKETPVPSGAVPQWIVDETEEDLQGLCDILTAQGVEVHRPRERNFVETQGMYNYCPRDRLLIFGDDIIDPAMMYPCRDQEIECLDFVTKGNKVWSMPRDHGMTLDAANVLRLGPNKMLYLESASGNRRAAEWLSAVFPHVDIHGCNFYGGVHIDSTIVPICEGLVLLNASRVTPENCPKVFDDWQQIYISEVVEQDFYQYPYASKWIALNMLVVKPGTVIVDSDQVKIINLLEKMNFTVIPHKLRHSRTLGGGFHCVTLDLWRDNV